MFISGSLVRHPLDTHLLDEHLCYHMHLPLLYESLGLYFLAVSAPCFSSSRYLQVFGVLLLGSLAAALWTYQMEFISVWCFFAAVLSGLILLHFRAQRNVTPAVSPPAPTMQA